jgi:thioredoxin-like negative regulator of GroEL
MNYITPAHFPAEVLASSVPVLVNFYEEHCPLSRLMASVLTQIEQESGGSLKIVRIDAAADPMFNASLYVTAAPTLLLFHNRHCVGQLRGARFRGEIVAWVALTVPSRWAPGMLPTPQPEQVGDVTAEAR